jgi:aminoglycoside phosphotransferase
MAMLIEILVIEDCPHEDEAVRLVGTAAQASGVIPRVMLVEVTSTAEAERKKFAGSPTIRVNGCDVAPPPEPQPAALACRIYPTRHGASGVPPLHQLLAALARAAGRPTYATDLGSSTVIGKPARSGPGRSRTSVRHGYTNATRIDGRRVVKRYLGKDAAARMRAEVDAIRRTAGRVPVPPIVQVEEAECVVIFDRLPGRHGQELIDEGDGDRVLEAVGRTLRSLHAGSQPPTWTHGDYGPQNLLFDRATLEVTGVLDWEFARRGDPIDDLAWAEWIVRMHHPGAASSLGRLFQGWGDEPAWDRRQAAMLSACHRFRDRAEHLGDPPAAALWARRARITADWHA